MTEYREADFSRLKTVSIARRPNKVDPSLLGHPPGRDKSFAAFWRSLPDILAAQDLRYVADPIARAAGRRAVVMLLGGHVIKFGLGPLLREIVLRWARRVTAISSASRPPSRRSTTVESCSTWEARS